MQIGWRATGVRLALSRHRLCSRLRDAGLIEQENHGRGAEPAFGRGSRRKDRRWLIHLDDVYSSGIRKVNALPPGQ